MRVAFLSCWNTACGVSLHAELIGRELLKHGYEVQVFAPLNVRPVAPDEPFVHRISEDMEGKLREGFMDTSPLITEDYEVLIIERLEWFPLDKLIQVYEQIKRKAKVVYVVHERKLPKNKAFWKFDFDAVVCFDERYARRWRRIYKEKVHVIPYPCHPIKLGDQRKAREDLNIPLEKLVVFTYSWSPSLHIIPTIRPVEEVSRKYDLTYVVLGGRRYLWEYRNELRKDFIDVRFETPPLKRIYTYLHAANVFLAHKSRREVKRGEIVVSSKIFATLGALTPIMTSDLPFVEMLEEEVIKYSDLDDLKDKMQTLFEESELAKHTIEAAMKYVSEHSSSQIAKRFIELFKKL